MIGTALRYHRPATLEQAADLLAEAGADTAVLGGGTMLVPMMGRRELPVTSVIDPRDLRLDGIEVSAGEVRLGARITYSDVLASDGLRRALPLLARMASGITGGAQIRNQGTIGGSACFANPSSDVPACLVALGATLHVHGASGARAIDAAAFFVDAFETACGPEELLVAITVPVRDVRYGYAKLKISESSWPIATAVAAHDPQGGATWITLGGVHRRPLQVEATALGAPGDAAMAAGLAELVRGVLDDPWSDALAPGEYRRDVAAAIARRALADMMDDDGGPAR